MESADPDEMPGFFFLQMCPFSGFHYTKGKVMRIKCLAHGHNTVPPVKLEPAFPQSQVKHSTTEPLRSFK